MSIFSTFRTLLHKLTSLFHSFTNLLTALTQPLPHTTFSIYTPDANGAMFIVWIFSPFCNVAFCCSTILPVRSVSRMVMFCVVGVRMLTYSLSLAGLGNTLLMTNSLVRVPLMATMLE